MNTRNTKQREVIKDTLNRAEGPLSVINLHKRALEELPNLGIATVYRTLRILSEEKIVQCVSVDGESLYELTGKGHHHHFACTNCKKIFSIAKCPIDLPYGTEFNNGFIVHNHEITLYGLCPTCKSSK